MFVMSFSAHANLLTNFSFETPASPNSLSLPVGSITLTGWTVTTAEIAQVGNTDPAITPQNGLYSLDLAGFHDSSPYGGVRQTIATVSGATYSISFYVGAFNGTSMVRATAGNLNDLAISTSGENVTVWSQANFQFVASGASTAITLSGIAPSAFGTYIGLDNVAVDLVSTSGVPEPATFAVVGLAIAGLIRMRIRR